MRLITPRIVLPRLPKRSPAAHKGKFGRVLVVAGSRTMGGAGFLCALGALRAGAGLVAWALPASIQPAFAAALPEVITVPLAETTEGVLAADAQTQLSQFCDTFQPTILACGPGMGNSPFLWHLLEKMETPAVFDAAALNFLASHPGISPAKSRPCIFTPHPGEMARLLSTSVATEEVVRQEQVRALAEISGAVAVLKGAGTLVYASDTCWKNTTGSCALAKGGSGDVLTGLIAGLWAQGSTDLAGAEKAALCGVYLHGLAGEIAAKMQTDYGVLAREVAGAIPAAIKQLTEKGSSL